jgi:hypothetical protein
MSPRWKWPRRKGAGGNTGSNSPQSFSPTVANSDKLHWFLTGSNGDTTLVVMCPDGAALSFPHDHPNFVAAEKLAREDKCKDSAEYKKLFDVEDAIRNLFGVITDRVRVAEGVVYFDEKPIHNVTTDRILQFMEEGRTVLRSVEIFFVKLF